MASWARFVLGHKRLVALLWVLCLVPAVLATMQVEGRLSQQTALPGQPGYLLPPDTTVDSPGARQALGQAFAGLAQREGVRVVSYATTGDRRFVSADGRTTRRHAGSPEALASCRLPRRRLLRQSRPTR